MSYLLNDIYEVKLDTIDEFLTYTSDNLLRRDIKFGFRGHSDSQWQLIPSMSRLVLQVLETFPNRFKSFPHAMRFIKENMERKFSENLLTGDQLTRLQLETHDIWQYGQHFGLPTQLLDWTYSPYVGLYFALRGSGFSSTRSCVWVLDVNLLEEVNFMLRDYVEAIPLDTDLEHDLENLNYKLEKVEDLGEANKRRVFQQGFFTNLQYFQSIESWLKFTAKTIRQNRTGRPLFKKITFNVDPDARLYALDKLDKMNVNSRVLFPGISGSVGDAVDNALRNINEPTMMSFEFST